MSEITHNEIMRLKHDIIDGLRKFVATRKFDEDDLKKLKDQLKQFNSGKILKERISRNIPDNIYGSDFSFATCVANYNILELVPVLAELNYDLNALDAHGHLPTTVASAKGLVIMLETLEIYGADLKKRDATDKAPLDVAKNDATRIFISGRLPPVHQIEELNLQPVHP
jgi:hypothetical protein